MYNKTMAKVISSDGETELFEILAGVLQYKVTPLPHICL